VIGGCESSRESQFLCFDVSLGSWAELPRLQTSRSGCAAAAAGSCLYVVGGWRGEARGHRHRRMSVPLAGPPAGWLVASPERFDPVRGRWEVLPDLPTPRSDCAAVTVDNLLYVLGGSTVHGGKLTCLSSFERFDPKVGLWCKLPPMPTPRDCLAVAVLDGRLYVLGGTGAERRGLDRVERYDTRSEAWVMPGPPMLSRRCRCAVVVVGPEFQKVHTA